jgi:hypothetical protein
VPSKLSRFRLQANGGERNEDQLAERSELGACDGGAAETIEWWTIERTERQTTGRTDELVELGHLKIKTRSVRAQRQAAARETSPLTAGVHANRPRRPQPVRSHKRPHAQATRERHQRGRQRTSNKSGAEPTNTARSPTKQTRRQPIGDQQASEIAERTSTRHHRTG